MSMFGRSKTAVVLAILVVACAAEPVEEPTTTSVMLGEASTTTAVITTTSDTAVAREPAVLSAGRTVVLEPGSEYVGDGFVVPLSFRVEDEGWRWYGVADDWAYLGWVSDGELAAAVAIVAYRTSLASDELVDAIVSIDGVDTLNERRSVNLNGLPALALDVEGGPTRGQVGNSMCTGPSTTGRFFIDQSGIPLVRGAEPFMYGIASCETSRLWVVEVAGRSITLIGGSADPDRFEELISVVERLVDSLAFEAP